MTRLALLFCKTLHFRVQANRSKGNSRRQLPRLHIDYRAGHICFAPKRPSLHRRNTTLTCSNQGRVDINLNGTRLCCLRKLRHVLSSHALGRQERPVCDTRLLATQSQRLARKKASENETFTAQVFEGKGCLCYAPWRQPKLPIPSKRSSSSQTRKNSALFYTAPRRMLPPSRSGCRECIARHERLQDFGRPQGLSLGIP